VRGRGKGLRKGGLEAMIMRKGCRKGGGKALGFRGRVFGGRGLGMIEDLEGAE